MPSKMIEPHLGKVCTNCNLGRFIEFPDGNEWNCVCNECGAILFCYAPLPHQYDFHADPSKYKMFAGKLNLPA